MNFWSVRNDSPSVKPATPAAGNAIHRVREFWEANACGEVYAEGPTLAEQLREHARTRYALEPYIVEFARFHDGAHRDVLEIGVGMGADHLAWAAARPRSLTGIDLTLRGVTFTRARLELSGERTRLLVADAECLPLPDASMDLVYSWGVLHHSPDTPAAIREVQRVLRPGGLARIMVYHRRSIVGCLLWLRYALGTLQPWRSLDDVYAHHLESPGTKAYSPAEVHRLFEGFAHVTVRSQLSFSDLLDGAAGQRHNRLLMGLVRRLWPRWLVRRLFRSFGLYALIEARR